MFNIFYQVTEGAKGETLKELMKGMSFPEEKQMKTGYWLKDGRNFVNLAGVLPDGEMSAPVIYQFAADGSLAAIRRAATARFDGEAHWRLEKVEATLFSTSGVKVTRAAEERWETRLGPGILKVMAVEPNRMSALELLPYLHDEQSPGDSDSAPWGLCQGQPQGILTPSRIKTSANSLRL